MGLDGCIHHGRNSDSHGHDDLETKLSNEEANLKVLAILDALEPVIKNKILGLIEDQGAEIALSVVSNVATSLLCTSMMMANSKEWDVNNYMSLLIEETIKKYQTFTLKMASDQVINKAKFGDGDPYTCKPLN